MLAPPKMSVLSLRTVNVLPHMELQFSYGFRVQLDPQKAYSLKVWVPSVTLRGGVTFSRWDLVRCNWVTGDVILRTDDVILIGPQSVPTPYELCSCCFFLEMEIK